MEHDPVDIVLRTSFYPDLILRDANMKSVPWMEPCATVFTFLRMARNLRVWTRCPIIWTKNDR